MAEQSAGAHRDDFNVPNNGWRQAMVNAGPGHEFLALHYRNSDRIIWDNEVLTERLWARVLQGKGLRECLSVLDGEEYSSVLGEWTVGRGERWVTAKNGINERMGFLKYGAGQVFRPHCDGTYGTPDGLQRSYYTLHLYLNDSAQALEQEQDSKTDIDARAPNSISSPLATALRGGATTFHSSDKKRRFDVDPKAGRVLIFQQRRLLHSGDDVYSGIKYTMRSDLMYEFEGGTDRN